ncbi:trypsin-like serine protease [Bdellovibrio sp. NC01]|uniref:S1 family peptidase n=1 Tax=Bdellovibrio sp. NC01 TaxID=2220073 RepID=UPI001AEFB18C|nr:serine protease [Bdellovibrio sp. NC01]
MNRSVLVLGLIALVSCAPKNSNNVELAGKPSIINGQEVKEGASIAASIVSLYDTKEQYICTGTLIAPNIVLTAAHCMPSKASNMKVVFANNVDDMMSNREQDVLQAHVLQVTSFKANDKYNPNDEETEFNRNDIALVRFKGALPEGYKPATFLGGTNLLKRGMMVTVAGYGVDDVQATQIDPRKYKNLDQAIEDGEVFCDDNNRNCMKVEMSGDGLLRQGQAPISSLQETEVRLDERKSGTCSGDSGGPAFIQINGQYLLWGVTSRGSLLCNSTGVYTNALEFKDWINQTIPTLF